MRPSSEIREQVNRYLLEVAMHLESRSPVERREILEDLEAHLYEALRRQAGGEPTLADLETVLAEMDPPQSYARPPDVEEDVVAASARRTKPGLGRWALGVFVGGIVLFALLAMVAEASDQDDVYGVAGFAFVVLEILALVLGLLSWRETSGKIAVVGVCVLLGLAVFVYLFSMPACSPSDFPRHEDPPFATAPAKPAER